MSDEPIVEIVTTSEPAVEVVDETAPAKASLLQRFRLPLMIAGAVLGVLLLLGLGLGLGFFIREFNEKQYVDQITLLRGALQRNADGWREARLANEAAQAELIGLKAGQLAVTASYAAAQTEIKQLREALATASAAAHAATQPAAPAVTGAAPSSGNKGYLRFGNTRCVIRPGEKIDDMANCLKGEPTPATGNGSSGKPSAAPAKPAPSPAPQHGH
ncbi:hypothetical protein [Chitinolyticbacter meiyuanensis]|uniref:hypothetical protein n=1 Tax=Chitinolyticbacter meiyuanensis TaxID=682798 RepID=UPI0011E5D102|nr:hypothetical protein [Chitinolyticbacter meiyuanensis]